MHFLPDVYVPCEVCKGARYNRDTLDITFKGKNISEVLDLSCEEALEFFANQPAIARHMQTIVDVGLGYVRLGQPAPTLSGGEAQRVKLASELAKRSTGHTIYILDEPTTGLHFEDIRKLLTVLSRLVDQGNTVLVIEHNLDVIKTADWIIDLGPEGGSGGGTVVVEGTPELVAKTPESYTGQFLAPLLDRQLIPVRRAARPAAVRGRSSPRVVGLSLVPRARPIADPPYSYHGHRSGSAGRSPTSPCSCVDGLRHRPARAAHGRRKAALMGGRRRRSPRRAIGISLLQLFVGDALLPRFVVFGAAILLVPWYLLCAALATDGRSQAASPRPRARGQRHGQLVGAARRDRSGRRAPGPAGRRSCASSRSSRREPATSRWSSWPSRERIGVLVLDREAQVGRADRGPGRRAARAGRAGAHPLAVLRGVARQAAGVRARAGRR